MNEFTNCRFLETVQTMSEEDIQPSLLNEELDEFISTARQFLYSQRYVVVEDVFDDLVHTLQEVADRKKKALFFAQYAMPCAN